MELLDLVEWHAPDLWEKFYLEQYQVSKAFHQLHEVKCCCKRISNSQPAPSTECECEERNKTQLPHHSEIPPCLFEWLNTCTGESFTFGQDVALPQEPWEHCPPQHPQGHLSTGTKALQLHSTSTSQLKVDVLLYVFQKSAPKPTPRENRTQQKTT